MQSMSTSHKTQEDLSSAEVTISQAKETVREPPMAFAGLSGVVQVLWHLQRAWAITPEKRKMKTDPLQFS